MKGSADLRTASRSTRKQSRFNESDAASRWLPVLPQTIGAFAGDWDASVLQPRREDEAMNGQTVKPERGGGGGGLMKDSTQSVVFALLQGIMGRRHQVS